MNNLKLSIPTMQSEHCQNRVKNVISQFQAVEVQMIQPGIVEFKETATINDQLDSIKSAIEAAGYQIETSEINQMKNDGARMTFNTTIKCTGCLSKVQDDLDNLLGVDNWDVNIHDVRKTLTVRSTNATPEEIMETVKKAGYEIQPK